MPSLKIRVAPSTATSSGGSGLVAELDQLEPKGTGGRLTRKVAVPTGGERLVEGLAPGRWEVRIVTAGGRVPTQEVSISDDDVATATFVLPAPAKKESRIRDASTRSRPAGVSAGDRLTRGAERSGLVGRSAFADAPRTGGNRAAARPAASAELYWSQGAPAVDAAEALNEWARLADALSRGATPRFLWLGAEVTRPEPDPDAGDGMAAFVLSGEAGRRGWALAATGGERRLHAVPAPWRLDGAPSEVVLVVGAHGSPSRIVLRDAGYAGLLDYLATGAVAAASDLMHLDDELAPYTWVGTAELLRLKGASPFGACAAAYALLGSEIPGQDEAWHPWIANLSRLFEWLPDGAILLARLRLTQARSEAEVDAALPVVLEALRRGVPFYRQGFDWLLQAMLQFDDDPTIRECRRFVQDAAAALDMSQVFTTMRL